MEYVVVAVEPAVVAVHVVDAYLIGKLVSLAVKGFEMDQLEQVRYTGKEC